MASSLGSAFGVAISATVYAMIANTSGVDAAATGGIIANVIFAVIALLSIIVYGSKQCREKVKLNKGA